MKRTLVAMLAAATTLTASSCSLDSTSQSADTDTVNVVVGYQSKTINTVTAGTC